MGIGWKLMPMTMPPGMEAGTQYYMEVEAVTRRIYLVNYYKNFSNTYSLRYVTSKADLMEAEAEGYERITRREAVYLARAERWRRENDQAMSGYANESIYPWCKLTPVYWKYEPALKYPYIVEPD